MKKNIIIGTRGSKLALWQAEWVKNEIRKNNPFVNVEIVKIKTIGDRIVDRPLAMVGGKGLFVKEIEQKLLQGDIDLAVHSMKDMPGELPEGLTIGAVPLRENPFDVLISKEKICLFDLPVGSKIGTSSLRRASQIKHARPDIITESIRGNLDTRLRKLSAGEFDAIILAAAGIIRLGMKEKITEYLDENIMLPAVGQGALCIESRKNDQDTSLLLKTLNHMETGITIKGERAFLKRLEGSCHIPVACFGKIKKENIILTGLIASEDGSKIIKETIQKDINSAEQAGIELADSLLAKGGRQILNNLEIR